MKKKKKLNFPVEKAGKKGTIRSFIIYTPHYVLLGHAVAQLVEALRYKPEGGGFDPRLCHWIFSLM